MCGIAGILGGGNDDVGTVRSMIDRTSHRGPDGRRVQEFEGAVLGHCRLSIIDLSERASQPMVSTDGRYAVVFNGELYNYLELRSQIDDYPFRTTSDTEVLLAAWRKWGEGCLSRLNGMFAFCIYDRVDRSAFLARDRFGQKPLFLHEEPNRLLFASEVKGLLAVGIPVLPNMAVWGRYLATSYYDDTAESLFGGVSQLLPGECATYSRDAGLKRRHYYRLADHYVPLELDEAAAAERVREAMVDACRLHMRADVPVGIMLSGGLDSATLLSSLALAGELNSRVKCFSVDFGPDLSERKWIESSANHHGLQMQVDSFTPAAFAASIRPQIWHQEAPIGGLMNCALGAVVSAARKQGFPVLQCGAGPDEAFGGYRNHHNLFLGLAMRHGARGIESQLAAYARNWGVSMDVAKAAAEAELENSQTAIDGTVPVRPECLSAPIRDGRPLPAAEIGATGDALRDSQIHYLQGSKIPRNARMLDRLSMGFGVEIRSPFLDHRLVELGLGLAPELYFLEGRSKGIVRSAFNGAMGDDVRLATKRSIQAPQGTWLRREPMADYVEGLISSRSFAERGLFDVKACASLFSRFKRGEFDNSFFVWQWINTEEWFRMFADGDWRENSEAVPEIRAVDWTANANPCREEAPQ